MQNKKQDKKKLYFQIVCVVFAFSIFSFFIFLKDTSHLEKQTSINKNEINDQFFYFPIYEESLLATNIQNWSQNRFKINNLFRQQSIIPNRIQKHLKKSKYQKQQTIITQYQKQLARNLYFIKNRKERTELEKQQKQYFQQKYHISQYKQLPFCIVVSSYNNAKDQRYLNNINSILQQEYKNYHIVFFDDSSDDNTGRLVQKLALDSGIPEEKLQIIINHERKMPLHNFYHAAKSYCQPYEIFVIVDGDDQLIGTQVFQLFNSIYQSRDLWVVYSNFLTSKQLQIGYSLPYTPDIIQRNLFRKAHFVVSHLRSFYTKLLTLIQEKDLKDEEGNWFKAANDVAMFIPILEMAHERIAYIPELTYIYNASTGLNNHKTKYKQQQQNRQKIKGRSSYTQLKSLFTKEQLKKLQENTGRQS